MTCTQPQPLTSLASDPELYPHTLDPVTGQAWFVRLSRRQYEEASFLDHRVLQPGQTGEWLTLDQIEATVADLPERCHFIFHIGHVGSTLLSRLLGAMPGLFSVREPTPLPALAQIKTELGQPEALWSDVQFERRTALFLKLWSRTFEPGQAAVIKATSWGAELAAALLARPSRPKALFMAVQPEVFLAGVTASPGALEDVRNTAQSSLRRLHDRLGETAWTLHSMSLGERIAMSWACEMTALTAARETAGDRALWIDFETFLARPAEGLAAALDHLGVKADSARIDALVAGPIMRRYSKLPQHPFDTAFRRRVLDQSRTANRDEIAKGMAWLDQAADRFQMIAQARAALAG